jgi:hypothetical protein
VMPNIPGHLLDPYQGSAGIAGCAPPPRHACLPRRRTPLGKVKCKADQKETCLRNGAGRCAIRHRSHDRTGDLADYPLASPMPEEAGGHRDRAHAQSPPSCTSRPVSAQVMDVAPRSAHSHGRVHLSRHAGLRNWAGLLSELGVRGACCTARHEPGAGAVGQIAHRVVQECLVGQDTPVAALRCRRDPCHRLRHQRQLCVARRRDAGR